MIKHTKLHILFSLGLLAWTVGVAAQTPAAATQTAVPPGRVVISGAVPDEATKAVLMTRLQELYGTGQIIDQITVGGVVSPPNWSSYVPKLINQNLKLISKGQLAVEGTTVSMRGEVSSEAVRQSIASDFAGALNPGFVIKNGLRIIASSQSAIDQALDNRVIEFEPGSPLLTPSGKRILDEMAVSLKKTGTQKMEVIGHTDNQGSHAMNMALSRSRADSVKIYLVAKGIPAEVIGASGMGADQPVTSNATDEGRKRNRRIEFRMSR